MLHMMRTAREMPTLEGRRLLVCRRLLAFMIFMQSHPNQLHYDRLFYAEYETLCTQILGLVEEKEGIPDTIVAAALRAMACQV